MNTGVTPHRSKVDSVASGGQALLYHMTVTEESLKERCACFMVYSLPSCPLSMITQPKPDILKTEKPARVFASWQKIKTKSATCHLKLQNMPGLSFQATAALSGPVPSPHRHPWNRRSVPEAGDTQVQTTKALPAEQGLASPALLEPTSRPRETFGPCMWDGKIPFI